MRRAHAPLLAVLVAMAAGALHAEAGEPARPEDAAAQVTRLREELAALSAAAEAAPTEALVEELNALRQEIDALLARLAAPPATSDEKVEPSELPAPAAAPDIAPAVQAPAAEAAPTVPSAAECAELAVFDSNEDGVFSGLDRYWRYFRLWLDDGDGAIDERELRGLYDAGIGELTVDLRTFRTVDGATGDVLRRGAIRLAPLGKRTGEAALVLDADRLAGGGELTLEDGAGAHLRGFQALTSEMRLARADGEPVALSCP